jgi:hypothetical protein
MRVSSIVPVLYRQRQRFHCVQQRMLHVWSYIPILRQEYTQFKTIQPQTCSMHC